MIYRNFAITIETYSNQHKYDALVKISQDDFKAFLYDCDGTLADNMPAHTETYIRVAAEQGVVIDGAIIDEFAGLPIVNVVEQINHRYQTTFIPEEFKAQKYKIFLEEYIEKTQPIDYVVNHLKNHAGQVHIAVVSGSSRVVVERTLQILGIDHLIEVLVCALHPRQAICVKYVRDVKVRRLTMLKRSCSHCIDPREIFVRRQESSSNSGTFVRG